MTFDLFESETIRFRGKRYRLTVNARLTQHQVQSASVRSTQRTAPTVPGSTPDGHLTVQLTRGAYADGDFDDDDDETDGDDLLDEMDTLVWRGDFTPAYVEDLTQKTGNFKRFPVFVEMLVSAMRTATTTVSLDLLTFDDLQALRNGTGSSPAKRTATSSGAHADKRYLIMTYAVAFDRVHYPLPLRLQERAAERAPAVQTELAGLQRERALHLDRISKLLRENDRLKHDLKFVKKADVEEVKADVPPPSNEAPKIEEIRRPLHALEADKELVEENLRLKREIDMMTRDRHSVEKAFHDLRDETRLEFQSIQNEFRQMAGELSSNVNNNDHLDYQVRRCYNLIEQLLDELKKEKMTSHNLLAQKQAEIKMLKDEVQKMRAQNLASGVRSSAASYQRKNDLARSRPLTKSYSHSQDLRPSRRVTASPARSNSSNSSSYQRFDPTAYIRDREAKMQDRRSRSRSSSVDSFQSRNSAPARFAASPAPARQTARLPAERQSYRQPAATPRSAQLRDSRNSRGGHVSPGQSPGARQLYHQQQQRRPVMTEADRQARAASRERLYGPAVRVSPRRNLSRENSGEFQVSQGSTGPRLFGGVPSAKGRPIRQDVYPKQIPSQPSPRRQPLNGSGYARTVAPHDKENRAVASTSMKQRSIAQRAPDVKRVSDSLQSLAMTDIDARLTVLQTYFDSLRE